MYKNAELLTVLFVSQLADIFHVTTGNMNAKITHTNNQLLAVINLVRVY